MSTPVDGTARHPAGRLERTVTAEEIAAHRDVVRRGVAPRHEGGAGNADATTPVASPVLPFVVAWAAFDEAVGSVTPTPAPVVHVSQEVRQQRPLRPGERVAVELDVGGARRDRGGVRVALRSALVDDDGVRFAGLVTGLLLVGATVPLPFGELPPHPTGGPARWETVVSRDVPLDLPRRYAEVSGDRNPIHLDAEAARAAGFPGVIAHGMSILALACEEVIDRFAGGRAELVRSVGGRFSTPVVPGEPLDVSLAPPDEQGSIRFVCRTPQGTAVKNGWVELTGGR